jgi:hypothetical protein
MSENSSRGNMIPVTKKQVVQYLQSDVRNRTDQTKEEWNYITKNLTMLKKLFNII